MRRRQALWAIPLVAIVAIRVPVTAEQTTTVRSAVDGTETSTVSGVGNVRAPVTGTAAISGTVVDRTTGQPLSNAMVVLSAGGGPSSNRQLTDARGRFLPARAGRVEGVVVSPDGPLAPVQMGFASAIDVQLPGLSNPTPTLSLAPGADGKFACTGVIPGRYVVTARTGQVTLTMTGYTVTGGGSGGPPTAVGKGAGIEGPGAGAWASAEVQVTSGDVSQLVLTLQPAIVIPGTIRFDGDRPPPATVSTNIRFTTQRSTGYSMSVTSGVFGTVPPPPATPTGPLTFEFRNVMPGTFQLTAQPPDGWSLRSAASGGTELLDQPLTIEHAGGSVAPIEIVFSDRHTELSGRLQTRAASRRPTTSW
jgi:hypothetical protein